MNSVLMLTRNNLDLTRRAVESVLAQDIPIRLLVLDNDSTDGTRNWLGALFEHESRLQWVPFRPQLGVSAGWNWGLRQLFDYDRACRHVLVLNNDVVLPRWFYRTLLEHLQGARGVPPVDFVTGVAIGEAVRNGPPVDAGAPLSPNPDFSAFLMGRRVWQAVGEFNEQMVHYASDCDYHVRAHRLGVPLWKANVPYWHLGSGTMKRASEEERAAIAAQANADRAKFRAKYGCVPGEPEYAQLFA